MNGVAISKGSSAEMQLRALAQQVREGRANVDVLIDKFRNKEFAEIAVGTRGILDVALARTNGDFGGKIVSALLESGAGIQNSIAMYPDSWLRQSLARNESITPAAQLLIAKYGDVEAKLYLEYNKSITPEAKLLIAEHKAAAAAEHKLKEEERKKPHSLLQKLGQRLRRP
jgi:hypothetical protein